MNTLGFLTKKTLQLMTVEMGFFTLYCKRKIKVDIKFLCVKLEEQNKNTLTNRVAV